MPLIIGQTAGGVLIPVLVDANGVVSVALASALPAGTNNIGDVDVLTLPALPIGTNEIGKIQARNYGLVGGAFQKDPLRLGYSDTEKAIVSNTSLAAGTNNLDTTAVPAGEIHVMTNMAYQYVGTVASVALQPSIVLSGGIYPVDYQVSITASFWYTIQGWWVLKEGDYLRLLVKVATLNDDAHFRVSGFRVDIDQ